MKAFWILFVQSNLSFLAASVLADPIAHRGPVTSLLPVNGEIYSCSQAGIFRGIGKKRSRLVAPQFRTLSLTVADGGQDLVLAGGLPGESGIIASWNFKNKTLTKQKIADDLVYAVAASAKSHFAALANGHILEIESTESKNAPRVRHRHTAAARTVSVSASGRFLASGGMDRVLLISRLDKKSEPIVIQDHSGAIDCLTFSRDGMRIASGARDGKVRIHFSEGGKLIRTYQGLRGQVTALAWGKRLVAGTSEGCLYELGESGDDAKLVKNFGKDLPVTALALDPGNKILVGIPHGVTVVLLN